MDDLDFLIWQLLHGDKAPKPSREDAEAALLEEMLAWHPDADADADADAEQE